MNSAKKSEGPILTFNTKSEDKSTHQKQSFKKNTYFYKVSNHSELVKLGTGFLEDFKNGLKSFAIGSTGYLNSQQKTIVGLASFFDHHDDLKIAIITDNLFSGVFSEIIKSGQEQEIELPISETKLPIFTFYSHFDFLDLNKLLEIPRNNDNINYEQRVEEVINHYDLILWDLPELPKLEQEPESYFPILQSFDSLTIIVSRSSSRQASVGKIKEFFGSYNINIKGLIFDPTIGNEEEKVKKKKPWWKIY